MSIEQLVNQTAVELIGRGNLYYIEIGPNLREILFLLIGVLGIVLVFKYIIEGGKHIAEARQ